MYSAYTAAAVFSSLRAPPPGTAYGAEPTSKGLLQVLDKNNNMAHGKEITAKVPNLFATRKAHARRSYSSQTVKRGMTAAVVREHRSTRRARGVTQRACKEEASVFFRKNARWDATPQARLRSTIVFFVSRDQPVSAYASTSTRREGCSMHPEFVSRNHVHPNNAACPCNQDTRTSQSYAPRRKTYLSPRIRLLNVHT